MLCLDVLWGAPASVLGCHSSQGPAAPMFSVLELLVLGAAPVLVTVPQISTAGHPRAGRSPGLAHCWLAVKHPWECRCGGDSVQHRDTFPAA